MPKQQSNLDAFLKIPKAQRVHKQTSLASWKQTKSSSNDQNLNNKDIKSRDDDHHDDDNNSKNKKDDEEKENLDSNMEHDDRDVKITSIKTSTNTDSQKITDKRRRRIIDDDDDDEDMKDFPDLDSNTIPSAPPKATQSTHKSEDTLADANTVAPTEPSPKKIKLLEQAHDEEDNDKGDDDHDQFTPEGDDDEEEEDEIELDEPDERTVTKVKAASKKGSKKSKIKNTNIIIKAETFVDEPLTYLVFCNTMEQIEAISGRLEIQAILTNLFAHVIQSSTPTDLYDLVYLSSNSVAPSYECIELGIGDAILIKAIGEAYGTNPSIIKQQYESQGDLGTVAKASKGKQRTLSFGLKPKPLLARDVLTVFRDISQTTGAQSQKLKVDQIKKLLVRAQGPEAKYIIRGLQGKLRIGLARSTVLISLAHAFAAVPPSSSSAATTHTLNENDKCDEEVIVPEEVVLYRESTKSKSDRAEAAVAIIKKAYSEVPSYDSLLNALLRVPLDQLHMACTLTPGIPVEPMLAKPTKSIQEVLKRLNGQRFTCEFKYDGERAQVHMLEDGTFKVFSRNLLDTSIKYPEVPQYVKAAARDGVTSFVLDTEVVAFNRETGNLVPFQVLSTRKKSEESAESAKVQVIVQAFDLMYLNGRSLLNKSLSERRDLLRENFEAVESKFQFAKSLDHMEDGDTTVLEDFLDAAVKGQCEGLMVKTLDGNAAYEPSKRSLNWLKLKKDYLDGLGDSVDLVPLGGYYGRGKRTGTFGAYLLACYDPENEEFQSVCKLGTGFSDEDLKNLSESLKDHFIQDKPSNYQTSDSLACDVWFDPIQVWEVKAADLSKSSTHKGAIGRTGEAGRGIGLRFPRFERVRDDKRPQQATSSEQILEMYYQQDSVVNDGGADGNDDDDGI